MKILVVILALCSFSVFASEGRVAWKHATNQKQVQLLEEYKYFFQNIQTELTEFDERQSAVLDFFISEAWAAEMNCIYAGWPSRRVNNSCSSPQKNNPDYNMGPCGRNEMQCQPLLFGKGLCVSVASQKERSSAFSNCDKKKKKSTEEIIKEIKNDGKEEDLLSLMDFADGICKTGKQAGTGMCIKLKAAINKLRHYQKPALEISGKKKNSSQITAKEEASKIIDTVIKANKTISKVTIPDDCEPELTGISFDREEPRPFEFEYVTSREGADPAWDNLFYKDKNDEVLRPSGFELFNIGPNDIAGTPLDSTQKVEREWNFVSRDNSKRETYLWITDDAGSGYLSQRMESIIMIIPRKMKPSIEAIGDELHVTLTTGEKVIYDKNTKIIKRGILTEGKVDLNPDKFSRKFAPGSYTGSGISIRVNKRGEDPRLIPGNAVVTQNGKSCQVPAKDLWNSSTTEFKFSKDQSLVEFLNRKCGKKFNL